MTDQHSLLQTDTVRTMPVSLQHVTRLSYSPPTTHRGSVLAEGRDAGRRLLGVAGCAAPEGLWRHRSRGSVRWLSLCTPIVMGDSRRADSAGNGRDAYLRQPALRTTRTSIARDARREQSRYGGQGSARLEVDARTGHLSSRLGRGGRVHTRRGTASRSLSAGRPTRGDRQRLGVAR